MGEEPTPATGGCLCGAVRYEATGDPIVTGYCHCADCRRNSGAPVVTLVMFEAGQVPASPRASARSTPLRRGWDAPSAATAAPR